MQIRFSLIVLLGAISYGVLSTFVKLAYEAGFQTSEVVGSQIFVGWLMLLVGVMFFARKKIKLKTFGQLALVGITTGVTSVTYYVSLQYVPASIAIILLFQFTWMGVALEAILQRKFPSRLKLISVAVLIGGTLLASGLFSAQLEELPLPGILFGLCSAVSFTLFILVSEKVGTGVPPFLKSASMITGAMILAFLVFPPTFLVEGTLFKGLWKFALPLAFFGMVVPLVCFSIGMPKVGTGLGTILSAAELPTVIVLSAFVLREQISFVQYIGILIIIIGICIPQMSSLLAYRPRKKEEI